MRHNKVGSVMTADVVRAESGTPFKEVARLLAGSVDVSVTEGVVTFTGHMERKSETEIAVSMTRRIDGVVHVFSKLTHRLDDAHLRPDDRAPHGVAEDWLRRL